MNYTKINGRQFRYEIVRTNLTPRAVTELHAFEARVGEFDPQVTALPGVVPRGEWRIVNALPFASRPAARRFLGKAFRLLEFHGSTIAAGMAP